MPAGGGWPRRPSNPWTWLLAIALLALVAWSVGRMVSDGRRPEPEIGVTDDPSPGRDEDDAAERQSFSSSPPAAAERADAGPGGESGEAAPTPTATEPDPARPADDR